MLTLKQPHQPFLPFLANVWVGIVEKNDVIRWVKLDGQTGKALVTDACKKNKTKKKSLVKCELGQMHESDIDSPSQ